MLISSRRLKTFTALALCLAATATLGACATAPAAQAFNGGASAGRFAVGPRAIATPAAAIPSTGPSTGAPRSSFMALGAPALPPVGFMEFCTRYPADCGRSAAAPQVSMRTGAYDGYYWSTAFSDAPAASRGSALTPSWAYSPRARFDWTLVFGTAALSQVSLRSAGTMAPPPPMTDGLWARMTEVNHSVNAAIRETSDLAAMGVADHWDLPLADGRRVGDCEDFALEKRRALIAAGVPENALSIALAVTNRGQSHAVLVVTTEAGDYVLDSLSSKVSPWRDLDYHWLQRQAPGNPSRWSRVG